MTYANVCGRMRTYADCPPPIGGWNGEEIESERETEIESERETSSYSMLLRERD